ncbi:MAG TPA: ABC transporter permease [Terriglobia bacterium]|nr:ABC transporter permease [Terriglobia bacterium]
MFNLRALFHKNRAEQEMEDELRFHLERQIEQNIARGMCAQEARYAALRTFGNVGQVKEECRDTWGARMISEFAQDLRYGFRQLRRNPGFTAVAVLTLALGIGANTAIFSLIDAVMFKLLPVRQPEQLFVLHWASQGWPYFIHGLDGSSDKDKNGRHTSTAFSYPVFEAIHSRNRAFSGIFGLSDIDASFNMNVSGQSALASGEFVSGDYFSTLGVRAIIGRTITPADDADAAAPVTVISYGYWAGRFGRDPSVVGKTITVNGVPFTLAGVSAPEFFGLQPGRRIDAWVPLHTHPQVLPGWDRWLPKGETLFTAGQEWWVIVMGRLRPGVAEQQARAELTGTLQQTTAGIETPPAHKSPDISLSPPQIELASAANGLAALRREFSQPLLILMAVVALVLLIACANVANLLLARATSRQKEVAVRLALGAGRRRLVRQLLTEGLMLAAAGGAVGILLAYWASGVLVAFMSSGKEHIYLHVSPDLRVLGFTAFISALTGVLFGLAPALGGTRMALNTALKEGAGSLAGKGGRVRDLRSLLGDGLVASQIAMSMLLLVGAALFVRTLTNLANQDLGFTQRNLLLFGVDPTQGGYRGEKLVSFYQELRHRLESLPGVRSATFSQHMLVDSGVHTAGISIQGYTPGPEETSGGTIVTRVNSVGARFFETFGIPLLLGRTVGEGDIEGSPKVGVINQAFARKYFKDEDAIGRRFGFGGEKYSSDIAIVGVVGDSIYGSLRETPLPTIYVPYAQNVAHFSYAGKVFFEVRTAGNPKGWITLVRRTVQDLDKNLPLFGVKTQSEQIAEATFQERLFASLTSVFGLLALLLTCIGLYGVMAYSVVQRTREIGIRMALGAEKNDVLRMVIGQGIKLALIGVAIGVAGALALTRFLSSLLFGVKPTDPLTFITVSVVLIAVALAACYIPARRAAKADPMVALRYE